MSKWIVATDREDSMLGTQLCKPRLIQRAEGPVVGHLQDLKRFLQCLQLDSANGFLFDICGKQHAVTPASQFRHDRAIV